MNKAFDKQLELIETGYKVSNINPTIINPECISVEQVKSSVISQLQPQMSKAVWRPAPGRKIGFLIKHEEDLLGVAFLASPVISMGARDSFLELSKNGSERGTQLRNYADLSGCVATQPFGWHWNGGKLVALLATTFGDFWQERYGDELKGIITTSLWGKGSQYNRVYNLLGYTKGYGHEQINDERYKEMMQWLTDNGHEIPSSKFGAGSNPRMRRIQAYKKQSGDTTTTLFHGKQRGIYYREATAPEKRQEVINFWYERWGLPRYERTKDLTPPYVDGLAGKELANG
jgi:hypothetical protein